MKLVITGATRADQGFLDRHRDTLSPEQIDWLPVGGLIFLPGHESTLEVLFKAIFCTEDGEWVRQIMVSESPLNREPLQLHDQM